MDNKIKLYTLDKKQELETSGVECKIVHFVRHAQGTHNVSKGYRLPENHDALLTDVGVEQCRKLSEQTVHLEGIELVVTSPLTRTIQTSIHSFPKHLEDGVKFLALEEVRETVNFLCDGRRTIGEIKADFPMIDYSVLQHDHDSVWKKYEDAFGSQEEHTGYRESDDVKHMSERAIKFFAFLRSRPESEIGVVTHSCFLWTTFADSQLGNSLVAYPDDPELQAKMETW
eukprot:CAMPEP_0197861840 /NCGR_PEP_ID=MMETSP1438-20131217/38125_1 /TAXON_ID=1461541 /ORGANISM="Pterosperma sp., Strain CCMP1384" /LENGTH=227 /DNA_ID=CAMNT_0043479153 /DNA_START=216 /DNA_END=896 /DNA_ORIENTATION=-